jgi:uncharacterized protein YndB with AHSA1/START domain
MSDRIEKQIELKASPSRVWQALTDYREFGEWFGVRLDGPFMPGQLSLGNITYPGYEYIKWEALVQSMDPERLFSFTWAQPRALDRGVYTGDYSSDPKTLVEFRLEKSGDGTLLRVTESGFNNLPDDYRDEAFRRNEGGWSQQMNNIQAYLERNARPQS